MTILRIFNMHLIFWSFLDSRTDPREVHVPNNLNLIEVSFNIWKIPKNKKQNLPVGAMRLQNLYWGSSHNDPLLDKVGLTIMFTPMIDSNSIVFNRIQFNSIQ